MANIKPRTAFELGKLFATLGIATGAIILQRKADINIVDALDKTIPKPLFKRNKVTEEIKDTEEEK